MKAAAGVGSGRAYLNLWLKISIIYQISRHWIIIQKRNKMEIKVKQLEKYGAKVLLENI